MKYEIILKVKDHVTSPFEQAGKVVVSPEHVKAQIDAYYFRAQERMNVYDYVVLVNELTDDGEFVRSIR